ncbi:MAG: hypothetical protein VX607_01915 [Planctomycetota bacterium]|nr:hypothetical protein [Planctomycetota bacterium]
MKLPILLAVATLGPFVIQSITEAHFPWLCVEEGKAVYFFGESPAERNYKLPPTIAKAEVYALGKADQVYKVPLKTVESDDFIGLTSATPNNPISALVSKVTYGIYDGMALNYYTQSQVGSLPTDRNAYAPISKHLNLYAQVIDTEAGVDVFVVWMGKPLSGAEVRLLCEDGHEEGSGTTDKDGKVSFSDQEVEDGLNGLVVGHNVEETGKIGNQEFQKSANYLTMTFVETRGSEK